MDNLIYILFVSVFVPILLMAGLLEKKAREPITFVLIGIFVSVFAAEVNGLFRGLLPISIFEITIIVTPIAEEILKALPILVYATVLSAKKEKLFTASMAVGIGFAVLENAFYLLNDASFNMIDACLWRRSYARNVHSARRRRNLLCQEKKQDIRCRNLCSFVNGDYVPRYI